MDVQNIMTTNPATCTAETNLAAAAALMWQADTGILPVLDSYKKVVGVITDRDICMALGTRNTPASDLRVGEVISGIVYSCGPFDDTMDALDSMKLNKVRRLPVVANDGTIRGIISLNDIVINSMSKKREGRDAASYTDVMTALKSICQHVNLPTHADAQPAMQENAA